MGALTTFVASFDAANEDSAGIAVTETANASSDHGWTLYAFPPSSVVRVRITGVSNGYDLSFTVTVDDRGIFRGSFGSTAAAGTYTIAATSGAQHASAEIVNTP